jgi:pantothenate kinase type III
MAEECGFRKYSLIITGGDSKLLLDNMPEGIHIDHLTLLGIAAIWERENNDSKNLRSKNKR